MALTNARESFFYDRGAKFDIRLKLDKAIRRLNKYMNRGFLLSNPEKYWRWITQCKCYSYFRFLFVTHRHKIPPQVPSASSVSVNSHNLELWTVSFQNSDVDEFKPLIKILKAHGALACDCQLLQNQNQKQKPNLPRADQKGKAIGRQQIEDQKRDKGASDFNTVQLEVCLSHATKNCTYMNCPLRPLHCPHIHLKPHVLALLKLPTP